MIFFGSAILRSTMNGLKQGAAISQDTSGINVKNINFRKQSWINMMLWFTGKVGLGFELGFEIGCNLGVELGDPLVP